MVSGGEFLTHLLHLKQKFGRVLAGGTNSCAPANHVATLQASLLTGDNLLRQFFGSRGESKGSQ